MGHVGHVGYLFFSRGKSKRKPTACFFCPRVPATPSPTGRSFVPVSCLVPALTKIAFCSSHQSLSSYNSFFRKETPNSPSLIPTNQTKSAFPRIKPPKIVTDRSVTSAPPAKILAVGADSSKTITIQLALIVVDEPLKMNCAWGCLHINKNADPIFGASLNRAHWPAAAAIERRDWRAIRWLTSLAITERAISSGTHPHVVGAWRHLTTSVGIKPNCRWDASLETMHRKPTAHSPVHPVKRSRTYTSGCWYRSG
jgi:hypothetical protein